MLVALDLLLHILVLHPIMQFWNFYLVFLIVSHCYANLDFFKMIALHNMTDLTDDVSSRDPLDLKFSFFQPSSICQA